MCHMAHAVAYATNLTWHPMSHPVWLTVREITATFGISRRTLERRISKGDIHQSQIRREGSERHIALAELIRVFGEPKRRPTGAADERSEDVTLTDPARIDAAAAELVEQLKASLEREKARADQERARAERLEDDLRKERERCHEMAQRALPAPKQTGWLGRIFGR